ncbi:response regulator [Clostridium sp. AN503]|uniref:response regulator transcription factor n=1 Tax=Clostridium sp. AN503 TaxID=3160598 RepID=UPI00345AC7C5
MSEDRKYRLLIADDEMIERKVLYKTLKARLGDQCEIFQAENGREAVRIHQEEKIQIAILDIEMPGINGIGAAEKIRETDRDCCIIFLTAFDEFSYAKKAITVRALDYLLKPYEEKELMLVLEEAMRLTEERMTLADPSAGSAVLEAAAAKSDPSAEALYEDEHAEVEAARLSRVMSMISGYIREHYMHEFSMQDVARIMNYSEAYFCKLFKQCFGQNFTSYLTEYRVNEAKKMLEQPTVNVKEVGKAVGYGDANYFAKVFKRITGQSPTEYRQEIFQKMPPSL